jgi:enoyl-[acyl-carrier-protein] reductase (NADH)
MKKHDRTPPKGYLKLQKLNMANFLISENAKSISGQIFEMDYGIVTLKFKTITHKLKNRIQ